MTVVAEHVHELEEKLAELGLESDEITEILQVIEEHILCQLGLREEN